MVDFSIPKTFVQTEPLRPVRLQTDLPQLADLIESAFAHTMDSGGRSALQEMRTLGQLGPGLVVLSHLNDMVQGMSMGYVWEDEGRIVGNVSVYPADIPTDMGRTWIFANVAVYESYRGRGIANRLMSVSLDMIRRKTLHGHAILQVDHDNAAAIHLYRKHGFRAERAWTHWRRGGFLPVPERPQPPAPLRITQRTFRDMPLEMALAERVRPQSRGGVDWLRPTHPHTFRRSLGARLNGWLNFRDVQRLVVRSPSRDALWAWLQIESALGSMNHQLTLMSHPDAPIEASESLIDSAIRRYSREPLLLPHPHDDTRLANHLRHAGFRQRRTVIHMRYTF